MHRVALRAHSLIQCFQRRTPNPIWPLLLNASGPRIQRVTSAHALGLDVRDTGGDCDAITEFTTPLLPKQCEDSGGTRESNARIISAAGETSQVTSTWKLLWLIAHKIKSATEAQRAFSIVLGYTSSFSSDTKSNNSINADPLCIPLLLLTAQALARFNLLAPLRTLTERFMDVSSSAQSSERTFYSNVLLQLLSTLQGSSQASENLILFVLDIAKTRKIFLEARTYDMLLSSTNMTIKIARHLRANMRTTGYKPSAKQLEALMKVFRRAVKGDLAGDYQDQCLQEGMRRFDSIFASNRATEHLHPFWTSKHPSIHDLTSTLQAASFDKTVSTPHLTRLFERIRTLSHVSVVTYTVLLLGLYHRRQHVIALKYWDELLQSGLRLDKQALAIGLKILVMVDQLPRVLSTLETFASRSTVGGPRIAQAPVKVDVKLMNDLMRAFLKSGKPRPDAVFLLWDWMEGMYDVVPDAGTIEIVLQAAMKAMRMDDSLRGTMAALQLSLRRKRRLHLEESLFRKREEYIKAFTALVGTAESGTRPYRSGVWHEHRPAHAAREVFYDIMLGNHPQLRFVQSPVVPYKIKPEMGGGVLTGFGFTKPGIASHQWGETEEPSIAAAEKPRNYPSILPTDRTFRLFILLLGFSSQQGLVGLALSWMHALNIRPSKETLATALVFWSEVGIRAPLVERFGKQEGAYGKLENWLRDWVGEDGMPTSKEFGKATVYIESFRSS